MNTENRHDGMTRPAGRRHHWKRIHHSLLFWVGAFLFLAAIAVYVLSDDLSWRPANTIFVGEAQYSSKIVGNWQGRVEGANETISFGADGGFVSTVQPQGFIGRTLGQGVTGTIRGNWAIKGKSITLNVSTAKDERVLNNVAIATIDSFKPDEFIVKNSTGDTSIFTRL